MALIGEGGNVGQAGMERRAKTSPVAASKGMARQDSNGSASLVR